MSESNATETEREAGCVRLRNPTRQCLQVLHEVTGKTPSQLSEPDKQLGLRIKRTWRCRRKTRLSLIKPAVQVAVAETAALDFERATGRQLDLSSAQRAEITKLISSPAAAKSDRMSALAPKNDGASEASISQSAA